ncbi:hypothetical protein HDU86_000001 [Geranomyces michiganensis]|nr:hypothetical protein HDU86_000001 [Geranomyces michiganensis]
MRIRRTPCTCCDGDRARIFRILIEHLVETQTELFTLHKVFYPCESRDKKWCAVSRDEIDGWLETLAE